MEKETKNQRFKRVAEKRTRTVLRALRVLGNCGNRGNYQYSPEEVKKIFFEIDRSVKAARAKFYTSKDKEFRL